MGKWHLIYQARESWNLRIWSQQQASKMTLDLWEAQALDSPGTLEVGMWNKTENKKIG